MDGADKMIDAGLRKCVSFWVYVPHVGKVDILWMTLQNRVANFPRGLPWHRPQTILF